jgi:hypothetical protein
MGVSDYVKDPFESTQDHNNNKDLVLPAARSID